MDKVKKLMILRIIISTIFLILAFIPSFIKIKLILCLLGYLLIGGEIIFKAIKNIFYGKVFDENFLMTIATFGAIFLGEYLEAVTVMLFYQIGEFFEDLAVDKSRSSIEALMNVKPDYANIQKDGIIKKVNPKDVILGSIIIIKPGEKVPIDGKIIEGKSSLNTTALTGESLPRFVGINDNVISGCINESGLLKVKTTALYKDSTVSKILKLIENSDTAKANSENFITKFSKIYTPVVVICAVLLAVIPSLVTGKWLDWLNRALIFLVVSCPCALVVSVPLGFFAGIGAASKKGILIKGSNYLEKLSQIETVVFDKTGTLTKGNFSVSVIHPEIISKEELLEIAAVAESYSDHPISLSLKKAHNKKVDKTRVAAIENFPGYGIKAIVDGKTVYAGNSKFMKKMNIKWKNCEHSGTIVHVSFENKYLGHIVISDKTKPNAKKTIDTLRNIGIKNIVMLTGDYKNVSETIANELNIEKVYTQLLPHEKVEKLKEIMQKTFNKKVVFVGDGINDAPALKLADVGVAMGALGSDAAIETADIVLMDDNPEKLLKAIEISKKTLRIVKQNIFFALFVKILILLLGAVGMVSMWGAVFADVGVSLITVFNALRAMKIKNS